MEQTIGPHAAHPGSADVPRQPAIGGRRIAPRSLCCTHAGIMLAPPAGSAAANAATAQPCVAHGALERFRLDIGDLPGTRTYAARRRGRF